MTRIVLVTNIVAPDKLGGLERYVRELAEALAAGGDDVVVVAKTPLDRFPPIERVSPRLQIIRYRPPSKRNPLFAVAYPFVIGGAVARGLRAAGATRRALRAGDVVLHGHFPVPMLTALLAGLPFVYTLHAPVFKELLGERQASYALPVPVQRIVVQLFAALERHILLRALRVVTLSRFVADEARELAGPSLPLVQIQGGVDVDRFSPGPRVEHAGSPVLFCARRMVERTGVELLIEAMSIVVEQLPETHLYLAGDGPRRPAVEASISRLGLGASVTLLGRISDDDLLSWYRSADLCVTPTLYLEGFGLATAEALAVGTPTVVTPAGANSELVLPVHEALLAERVDAPALALALVQSWSVVRTRSLADESRSSVAPRMGWPSIAASHDELYKTIVREARVASQSHL